MLPPVAVIIIGCEAWFKRNAIHEGQPGVTALATRDLKEALGGGKRWEGKFVIL